MPQTDAERNAAITRLVQQQYERFPYPDIDPDQDPRGWTASSAVDDICYRFWAGRKKPGELRILDAGCGTGSPVCQCKLRAPEAHVVAVDLSSTSLDRARKRAARLGCEIEFHQLPLQRVGELGQTFDYIVTSGVLHHLPDPVEGLASLRSVLDPDGIISVMVYGTWGRVCVYALQAALRQACDPEKPIEEHIRLARTLLLSTPPWYPVHRPSFSFELQPWNDGGIVDLLLHVQDLHYNVPRVYEWVRQVEMELVDWLTPYDYTPENYVHDPALRALLAEMSREEREAIAELYHGAMNKQSFYLSRPERSAPDVAIANGAWRALGCRLRGAMDWDAMSKLPLGDDHLVKMSLGDTAAGPVRLKRWQAELIGQIRRARGRETLGDLVERPDVRKWMDAPSRAQRDRLVEEFLPVLLSRGGIALIEKGAVG